MKKLFLLLSAAGLYFSTHQVNAQDAFGEVIKSGQTEANKLATAYLNPLGKGFGVGLNNGWITSGKVFKPGRFEVRVLGSASFVPQDDKTFDLSALGYNASSGTVRLANPNDKMAPTFSGEKSDGPALDIYAKRPDNNQDVKVASFNSPAGVGIGFVPVPMAQVSVGLIKETELMVRFIPEFTRGDYSSKMFGIGVKHSIRQWIPVISKLPFDITAAVGFTNFQSSFLGIDVDPASTQNGQPVFRTPQQSASGYYDNQQLDFKTKAYSGNLVVSKTLAIITGYLGVNYSSSKTEFDLAGTYPVTVIEKNPPYRYVVEDIQNPINVDIKHNQVGLTGGVRLKLTVFSLFAQGTLSKYSSASVGLGLGWN